MEYENIEEIIEEGYDDIINYLNEGLTMEKVLCESCLIENIIANNTEHKNLIILIEETEANKERNLLDSLMQSMKKILEWINAIFKKFDNKFAQGVALVKNNDLNGCLQKIARGGNIPMVRFVDNAKPIRQIRNEYNKYINATVNKMNMSKKMNIKDKNLKQDIERYDIDKEWSESMRDIKITNVNISEIINTLMTLPSLNKEIHTYELKVKNTYNHAMNFMRNRSTKANSEKKQHYADNSYQEINAHMRDLTNVIKRYAKILNMYFNQYYMVAKKIVDTANNR